MISSSNKIGIRFRSLLVSSSASFDHSKYVKRLVLREDEADSNEDHEPALHHEGETPRKEFTQESDSYSTKDIANHDTDDDERMQDSHPLSV